MNKPLTSLIEKMTLDEKIGQLLQLAAPFFQEAEGQITGPMAAMGITGETVLSDRTAAMS